jgi:serine/threonine-protein kinase
MEYLDGESLGAASEKQRPMPTPRLLHIAKQIANALSAAHASGIVHRDLKPDNVMLINRGADRDFVKILDFGIAKVAGGESKLTQAGSVFGTPHYMSPEQAAGTSVDSRTDVYALGVILYELASGRVPFDADNFMGILTQHMYKAPVPILAIVPPPEGVPAGLDAVIQKCLSKKAEQRYASMDALVADLDRVEKGVVPEAVAEMMSRSGGFNVPADYFRSSAGMPALVPGEPALKPRPRWGLYAGVAGIAAAVALTLGILVQSQSTGAKAPPAMDATRQGSSNTADPARLAPAIAAPATTASAPVPPTDVLLTVDPPDAHVSRDGTDLGELPIAVHLAAHEKATLVITRAGYKTKSVTVDGSDLRMLVRLERVAGAAKPRGAAPKSTTTSSIGDFQDPFLKK